MAITDTLVKTSETTTTATTTTQNRNRIGYERTTAIMRVRLEAATIATITETATLRMVVRATASIIIPTTAAMGQHTLKNVNNYLNTNIYSYLETSGGQSSKSIFKFSSFYQQQSKLDICSSLRLSFSCIGV
jgi:hypothetical protein